jgi:hypothetical protein
MPQQTGGLRNVSFFCDECQFDDIFSLLVRPSLCNPSVFRKYDKTGGKFLVDAVKRAYFGPNVNMTQKRMEEFFNNPNNFVNP